MLSVTPGRIPDDVDACVSLWLDAVQHRDGAVLRSDLLDRTVERTLRLFAETPLRFAVACRPRTGRPTMQGFAVTMTAANRDRTALLARIAVRPDAGGHGLGRALLDDAIAAARDAGMHTLDLDVRVGNPATRLYEAAGFCPVSAPVPHELGGAPMVVYRLRLAT